jgi:hypothetical protein
MTNKHPLQFKKKITNLNLFFLRESKKRRGVGCRGLKNVK